MEIDWQKHHRFMPRPGWCGPATIWMVLDACGIRQPMGDIARSVWMKWYGTPPQLMAAYLAKYFEDVNYKDMCNLHIIRTCLDLKRIVIVNWHDGGEGHYSIVSNCDHHKVTMVDSSREHNWTYTIDNKKFMDNWFDCLTSDNRMCHYGLMLWVDPESVKL